MRRQQNVWQGAALVESLGSDRCKGAGRRKEYPVQLAVPAEAMVRNRFQFVRDIDLPQPIAFRKSVPSQLLHGMGKTDFLQILAAVESFTFNRNQISGKFQGIDFILPGKSSGRNHKVARGNNGILGQIAAGRASGQHLMCFDNRFCFRHKKTPLHWK